MKNSSKWLAGFGIVIGILVVTAIVLVLAIPNPEQIDLPSAGTPEGVVMRYFEALRQENYELAYGYLSDTAIDELGYTIETWSMSWGPRDSERMWKVSVTGSSETADRAKVDIELSVFRPDASISYAIQDYQRMFSLVKTDDGWKIEEPLDIPWEIRY